MTRVVSMVILVVMALAAPLAAEAQPASRRVPRIGYLDAGSLAATSVRIVPGLAAELVRLRVDVIVTGGAGTTRPAKEATSTIPIVMVQDGDPVGSGFVASLAQPGRNVTGFAFWRSACLKPV
jgi:ABC transporter substrate binding protein